MKQIVKAFFVAVMLVASCSAGYAQQPEQPRTEQQTRLSREQLAEKQARHIAHELAFSEEVTERFVTTYCNYQKEIWALGPRQHRAQQPTQSEQANEERIMQRFEMSEKILDIRKKYYKEYSKFLTQAQIEQVYEQERKFMNRHSQRGHKQRGKSPRTMQRGK